MGLKKKKDTKSLAGQVVKRAAQKQTTVIEEAAENNPPAKRYYSPREYGTAAEDKSRDVSRAKVAMQVQTVKLTAGMMKMEELRKAADEKAQQYQQVKGKFRGADAGKYEQQFLDAWTDAAKKYSNRYIQLQQELEAYRPYEDQYRKAVTDYNTYVTAEQMAYQDWRGTIRGADAIRQELKEVNERQTELENLMQVNNQYADGWRTPAIAQQIASNEARIAQLQDYLGIRGERAKLLEEELEWSEYYHYEDRRDREDFTERSKYLSTANGSEMRRDPLSGVMYGGYDDVIYDYINRDPGAMTQQQANNQLNDMSYLEQMTHDEITMYNYVYSTEGAEGAKAYLDTIRKKLTARQMGQTQQAVSDMTAQGVPGAVVGSVLSVGLSPVAGLQSLAGQLGSAIGGREIDPNASYNLVANTKNTIRSTVGEEIEKALGEKWGPVGSFAYDIGMNMGDMLMDASFGSSVVANTLIGSRAMAESVLDAKTRGLSDAQALSLGVVSGVAELLTERIGLDELVRLKNTDQAKRLFGRVLAGFGGESLEEGLTNVVNQLADGLISGDKSQFVQTLERYRQAGYSETDATWKALADSAMSVGVDMLAGGISGGIFGALNRSGGETEVTGPTHGETISTMETVEDLSKMETTTAQEVVGAENAPTTPAVGTAEENSVTQEKTKEQAALQEPSEDVFPKVRPVEENGGANNGEETGERVLPGGQEWNDVAGAGEPDAKYEQLRKRQQEESHAADAAAAQRRVKAENLEKLGRAQRISAQELGLRQGTEAKTLLELPRYEWDGELYDTANRLEKETGMKVRCVTSNIPIRNREGGVSLAKGYIDRVNGSIVLNVCHSTVSPGQIGDHEMYHWKMDAVGRISGDRGEVTRMAAKRIREEYSAEDFDSMVDAYIDGYADVYDTGDWAAFMERIYEEVMADAYAGINAFGADAARFRGTVNTVLEENGMGRDVWNAAEQETTAAPGGDQRIYNDEDAPPIREYEDISQEMPEYDWSDFDPDEVDFSIDKDFSEQVDDVIAGRHERKNAVYVGRTPSILGDVGLNKELPMLTTQRHLLNAIASKDESKHRHGLTVEQIKALPKKIGDPVLLMDSLDHTSNSVIAVTDMLDPDGLPVIAVIKANGKGMYNDVELASNFLNSYYGRKNFTGFINRAVTDNAFLYINKEKATTLSAESSTQWLEQLKGYDFDVIIRKTRAVVKDNDDARFSMDDELSREDYDRLMAEVAGDQSKRNEEFVKGRLTPEQYRRFKEYRREDNLDSQEAARVRSIERFEEAMEREELQILRAQQAEDAAAGRRELAAEEKVARDTAREKAEMARQERRRKAAQKREELRKEARERIRRAAENAPTDSAPTIARKELQDKLIGLFSVGDGQRAELRRMIGEVADRMLMEGSLDQTDLRTLINRLYDAGVMVIEPEEIYAEGRSYLKDEHIYVSPELIRELGDDWQNLRKKAWGLGVYLTTDRRYAGVDVWNADMASYLPGMFDVNETDQREMLERLLMIAEEGKAERISLVEYTKRIARAEHQSETALLENLERQVEEALRKFAEKASLETRLRDRENRRKAVDREKTAISREADRSELERQRQELADDREALREQNAAERDRLELQRAENERRNTAERRRLAEERAARRQKAQEAKRKKELKELQQKTMNVLQWIAKNRRGAPEAMQSAFDEVLGNIDLYAISIADEMNWSSKYGATWKDLRQMYLQAKANDPNFLPSDDLERIVNRLESSQLEELDFDQLRDLYQAAVGLRTEYQQRNNVISDSEWEIMEEVYSECVEEMKTAPKKLTGLLDRFLNLEQLTPMNVLEEMGGFNPNGTLYRFAKQLEEGERNVRGFTVKANRILADFLEENKEWVHKADGQGKDGIWYEVEIPELLAMKVGEEPEFGSTVKVWMTPMQKIHLYLESRNYDNLRHMTGGRTFTDRELYSMGERQEAYAKGTTIRMAPETVQMLVKDLTPQEMELANLLDRYYNDLAKTEINKVSNVLLGYDKAMGGKYTPIFTNQNYTKSEFGKFDGTAEGAGNLKERVKSKVPSYNISALDAFERNVDRTATYVGMAIPVRNWNTLMNWRTESGSFTDEMTHAWGEGRKKYIEDLIADLQNPMGEKQDLVAEMASKLQSNYISSVFGFNPGIVVKQLGSIPMAAAYLEWKHFPKNAIGGGKIDRELIARYTPDLDWRTMGYSMPETKQLKDAPNWSQKNKAAGLIFGGDAITAMDGWAASVLWPWAENKVRSDFPSLEVGDTTMIENGQSPFYKKVAEVFNDAVARSQSVSDQMHQGRLRKSKNLATKALTMFRSDTAQSYNVLRQLLGEMDYHKRMGKDHVKMAEKTRVAVGAAATAVLINSLWGTTVDLIVQAMKGKLDEEEKEPQAILENFFWGVIESYAGLSAAGDILAEMVGGWFTGGMRYDTEAPGVEQFNDIMQAADKVINAGKKGNWLGAVKTAAETIASYGGGIPVKNVEAYLKGLLSMVLPGVVVGYEDLLKAPAKADLADLEGDSLMVRLNNVLKGYGMKLDLESREAIATLYEQGYKEAVPSAAPNSVTIEGIELELDDRMRKAFDKTRSGIIEQEMTRIVGSAFFADADAKTQKLMLTKLYNYAAEKAKASVLADYEIAPSAQAIDEIITAGGSAADYTVFDAATAEMKAWQKALVLREWGTDEAVTGLMFQHLVSKSWEDERAELKKVGIDTEQFLDIYSMYGEIDAQDLTAGGKATNFAYWLDGQRYTDTQKAAIKEEMVFRTSMAVEASKYDRATDAGLSRDEAAELVEDLNALGSATADVQKWRVAIDKAWAEENQLQMLQAAGMNDAAYAKCEALWNEGVAPAAYVRAKELESQFNEDGEGTLKNTEWTKLIESITTFDTVLPGDTQRFHLTAEQKSFLWQVLTGSKSTKNNPWGTTGGERWLEIKEAMKETEEE